MNEFTKIQKIEKMISVQNFLFQIILSLAIKQALASLVNISSLCKPDGHVELNDNALNFNDFENLNQIDWSCETMVSITYFNNKSYSDKYGELDYFFHFPSKFIINSTIQLTPLDDQEKDVGIHLIHLKAFLPR